MFFLMFIMHQPYSEALNIPLDMAISLYGQFEGLIEPLLKGMGITNPDSIRKALRDASLPDSLLTKHEERSKELESMIPQTTNGVVKPPNNPNRRRKPHG